VHKGSRRIDRISPVGVELLVVPLSAFNKQSPVNLSTDASLSLPGRIKDSKICIQHSHYSNSDLIYVNWYLLQLWSVLPVTVTHVWVTVTACGARNSNTCVPITVMVCLPVTVTHVCLLQLQSICATQIVHFIKSSPSRLRKSRMRRGCS
jgi:hypothetical protein